MKQVGDYITLSGNQEFDATVTVDNYRAPLWSVEVPLLKITQPSYLGEQVIWLSPETIKSIAEWYGKDTVKLDRNTKSFMTLADFMQLEYPGVYGHLVFQNQSPRQIIAEYDLCKAAYEKYGDDGPPADCQVEVVRSWNFPKSMWWLKVRVIEQELI